MLFSDITPGPFPVRYISHEAIRRTLEQTFRRPINAGASKEVYHLDGGHLPYFRGLPKASIVLEVGCGGGQMRRWVEELGLNYCGTDVSKTRVWESLQRFSGPDFLSDVHNLPISDNCIDLAYSAAVVEHLSAPHGAVQEIFRALKPGGFYLGNCSFLEPWHDDSFFHVSPNGAAALLLQAGFDIIAIWPSDKYSGYKSLLSMDNMATKLMAPAGKAVQAYSRAYYGFKRLIRGAKRYSETDRLADLAKTAGAIDWVAQKPFI